MDFDNMFGKLMEARIQASSPAARTILETMSVETDKARQDLKEDAVNVAMRVGAKVNAFYNEVGVDANGKPKVHPSVQDALDRALAAL